MDSCSADGLLGSVMTLTGAMPEPLHGAAVDLDVQATTPVPQSSAITFERRPHLPPPRI